MRYSLLLSLTVAMFILSAPVPTKLMAQSKGAPASSMENAGNSSNGHQEIRIVLTQNHYYSGDEIVFTIVNATLGTIYYTFGCSVPLIDKVNGSDHTALTIDIFESIPELNVLGDGEKQICRWNQKAWQDPNQDGRARFQHFNKLTLVPEGQYQFRLNYYLNEKDIDFVNKAQTVYSEIFTIKAHSPDGVTVSD